MEKGVAILLIIFIVIVVSSGLIVFFVSDKVYESPEENCKVLIDNGDDKIEIVFLTENVEKIKINDYINFLLNTKPFSEQKEKFNFYYAGITDCSILDKGDDILFCYSGDLLKKSSACPNDYIIVLSDRETKVRSTAYLNVISLNSNHNKNVLLHEFGHVFSNLADEYIPSEIPRGAKNCAKECNEFEKYNVEECFEGCSKASYFRSSEDSVMKTLKTNDYRDLNTFLINKSLDKYN